MNSRLSNLANPQRKAIQLAREVALEKGVRPFLVGGPVRDLLLGRQVFDVDLTLENGTSNFARALARKIEGRVRSFPQFLTYKVTAEGLPEIDIATARKERYRAPGALPSVTAGRLLDDLIRRDFSINAMAMDLNEGKLLDPTGGEDDLRTATIRVLHDQSFIDDPTRVFRALRLAGRLRFVLEARTAELLHAAIRDGALANISRERIWRELFLAMTESEAPAIVSTLRESGALDVIFGPARAGRPLSELLERLRNAISADPSVDAYVAYTGILLQESGSAALEHLDGSGFSQKRAKSALVIAHDLGRVLNDAARAANDVERFRLYGSIPAEALAVVASERPEDLDSIVRFREYRNFKLPLRGNDLEVPLGPHVALALERTREAVYLGEIPAKQARSFATDLALQYLNRGEQPDKP